MIVLYISLDYLVRNRLPEGGVCFVSYEGEQNKFCLRSLHLEKETIKWKRKSQNQKNFLENYAVIYADWLPWVFNKIRRNYNIEMLCESENFNFGYC